QGRNDWRRSPTMKGRLGIDRYPKARILKGAWPVGSSLLLFLPSVTLAQPVSNGQPIEEIIVTAQKRSESSERVGIAITAADGKSLEAANVAGPRDLVKIAPSVQIHDDGNGANVFFNIRGVGERNEAPHNESPIALFIDDTYVPFGFGLSQPLF